MSLVDLWQKSRDQLAEKHLHQVIAFAGTGKLRDEGDTSSEFREFLNAIPSDLLKTYANECLQEPFTDSGFALQDVINEIGRRLGFNVTNGRYRGRTGHSGHDGLWRLPHGHVIVIEVKTTDAYRIDLETLAGYRRSLATSGSLSLDSCSMLIIVGRQDTGDLEAQVRGSRHAWDIRLISVEALLRLMRVKEAVEEPDTVARVHAILIPREFTRLDAIVDVVFSAAEEAKQEDADIVEPPTSDAGELTEQGPKFTPVAFHESCVARIERHLGTTLIRRTRSSYATPDEAIRLTCSISKQHDLGGDEGYWFAFHPYYLEYLKEAEQGFAAFGCGSAERLFLVPLVDMVRWLDGFYTTERDDRVYWHVQIFRDADRWRLKQRPGREPIDLAPYLLADPADPSVGS